MGGRAIRWLQNQLPDRVVGCMLMGLTLGKLA